MTEESNLTPVTPTSVEIVSSQETTATEDQVAAQATFFILNWLLTKIQTLEFNASTTMLVTLGFLVSFLALQQIFAWILPVFIRFDLGGIAVAGILFFAIITFGAIRTFDASITVFLGAAAAIGWISGSTQQFVFTNSRSLLFPLAFLLKGAHDQIVSCLGVGFISILAGMLYYVWQIRFTRNRVIQVIENLPDGNALKWVAAQPNTFIIFTYAGVVSSVLLGNSLSSLVGITRIDGLSMFAAFLVLPQILIVCGEIIKDPGLHNWMGAFRCSSKFLFVLTGVFEFLSSLVRAVIDSIVGQYQSRWQTGAKETNGELKNIS